MWIYDGEQWTEEGVSETEIKPENARRPEEMQYYPELQVIEIPLPRTHYVPPFPMI